MPHAKQGGTGKEALAAVGSKFDGMGFEKEHIGQTQVAAVDRSDDGSPEDGTEVFVVDAGLPSPGEAREADWETSSPTPALWF